jgi:hypothetical protein
MYRFVFIIICLALSIKLEAQVPAKMSYQAVIRDNINSLVVNQSVGMRISVIQGSISGNAIFIETQSPLTNSNGLISIEIGGGNNVSGNFSNINWSQGPFFIKTEADPNGGSNYSIVGISQLLSVPFALYSSKSEDSKKIKTLIYTGL